MVPVYSSYPSNAGCPSPGLIQRHNCALLDSGHAHIMYPCCERRGSYYSLYNYVRIFLRLLYVLLLLRPFRGPTLITPLVASTVENDSEVGASLGICDAIAMRAFPTLSSPF